MLILGELHTSRSSIQSIEKKIRKLKPRVLLHELIWDFSGSVKDLSSEEIKQIPQYAKGFNNDIFELAQELEVETLKGCDLSEETLEKLKKQKVDLKEMFALREARMLKVALRYSGQSDVVMVVGDIHLREKDSDDLGPPSSLMQAIIDGDLEATVERLPTSQQEAP